MITYCFDGATSAPKSAGQPARTWRGLFRLVCLAAMSCSLVVPSVAHAVHFEWELLSPTDPEVDGNPPGLHFSEGVYDPNRSRFVFLGGKNNSTGVRVPGLWEFNGTSWKFFTTSETLEDVSADWDAANGLAVFTLGSNTGSGTVRYRTWDGTTLSVINPTDPEGDGNANRDDQRAAFDLTSNKLMLYGGQNFGVIRSDTWEWTGVSWKIIVPTDVEGDGNPGPRGSMGMVYDPNDDETYLFGGYTTGSVVQEENGAVWAWNGARWLKITPTDPEGDGNPVGRRYAGFVWDPQLQKCVLIGGYDSSDVQLNDVWLWDGVSWELGIVDDDLNDGSNSYALGPIDYMSSLNGIVAFSGLNDFSGETWLLKSSQPVNFPDPNLEACVRLEIGIPSGPIYASDLVGVGFDILECDNVADVSGLEYATDLQVLYLENGLLADISPLSALTSLYHLDIFNTSVSDLSPISGLSNLVTLDVGETSVSDLSPVSGLSNLQTLYVDVTSVSDLSPLSGLNNLQTLVVSETSVSDLSPLSGLNNLQILDVSETSVSDLSPLSGLTNLQELYANTTSVSDLSPLSGLTNLQRFFVHDTSVSDLSPLSGLTNLKDLGAYNTSVSDLSPLSGLTNLLYLGVENTSVSDLSPLSGLSGLVILRINHTSVYELSVLLSLVNLLYLSVHFDPLNQQALCDVLGTLEARGVDIFSDEGTGTCVQLTTDNVVNVPIGGRATLGVVTSRGDAPFTYQWHFVDESKTDVLMVGIDSPVLIIDPAGLDNIGHYYCEVTDQYTSNISPIVTLGVGNAVGMPLAGLGGLTLLALSLATAGIALGRKARN